MDTEITKDTKTKQTDASQELHNILDNIINKYSNDEYMYNRIHTYIKKQLPYIIDGFKDDYTVRQTRLKELSFEKDKFINDFLSYNPYYYVQSTNKYFYYDGIHYYEYTEDNILHKILTTITKEKKLLCWKQKTKLNIMKLIKQNTLNKSIPETTTIQNVLSILFPTFFSTKTEAKYFLCILGDNINKKNQHLNHFIVPSCKQYLQELNHICENIFGSNLSSTIKYKFTNHSYENCRFLKMNENVPQNNNYNLDILLQSAVDILCVACHYSVRYGSSDTYVSTYSHDIDLNNYTFSLKNKTPNIVIDDFITNYIMFESTTTNQYEISWKNMFYIWKHYISLNYWPNILSPTICKQLIIEQLHEFYNNTTDSFYGLRCEYLPNIQEFLKFWDETITTNDDEVFEYEINEITFMFHEWCSLNNIKNTTMTDEQILDLIQFYYPSQEIIQNKYIYNICCSIWNKQEDIDLAIEHYKLETNLSIIRKEDAYLYYCKFIVNIHENREQIVSKQFFMKYIENLNDNNNDDNNDDNNDNNNDNNDKEN